jgi:hypothetical protein
MLTQDPRMLEYRRRTEAIQAVARERVSIARELHDIVAHSVTAMMPQSVAARRAVRPNPDLTEETLTEVDCRGITLPVAPRSLRRVGAGSRNVGYRRRQQEVRTSASGA